MTILDALPRPRRVELCGVPLRVWPITLGDLADLQAWVRDNSWSPFDVPPDVASAEMLWACVAARGEGWPPALFSGLDDLATEAAAYQAEWCHVALGRKNGLSRETSAKLTALAAADPLGWWDVLCAAYGKSPEHAAHDRLNDLDGAGRRKAEPPDWALAIGSFCVEWRVLPEEAGRLALTQWRLLNGIAPDAERKGYVLHRPPKPNARPREGESLRDAKARRKALVAGAHGLVGDWERSRAGGPPEGQDRGQEAEREAPGEAVGQPGDADQHGRQADQ